MNWTIHPAARLAGSITTPPDKSITHRAIMFAAVAEGTSVIDRYLSSEDCLRTLDAFTAMGVVVERSASRLTIHGAGFTGLRQPSGALDAGNSGTTVRLLAGMLAGQDFPVTIIGDDSLSRRPMRRIMEPLERMGVRIAAREKNYLPLEIQGTRNLTPIIYHSPVASAQVKSCVLLAGLQADGMTTVEEPLRSRDHTERMLQAAGVPVRIEGCRVSVTGKARLTPLTMTVPGDISSAAFFIIAGLLVPGSRVLVQNVGINPTRDGLLDVLRAMGAVVKVRAAVTVSGEPVADLDVRAAPLHPATIDAAIIPRLIDEIPAIVLAMTQARGISRITGAAELRVKESDRLKTVASVLNKMGAHIEELPDGLLVHGPTPLQGAVVESYGDHRIAMTAAVAGLIAAGETTVSDVACVATSFPGFLDLLQGLRA